MPGARPVCYQKSQASQQGKISALRPTSYKEQIRGIIDWALAERTAAAVDRAHALAGELRGVEERLASTTKLMGAVVDYAKTRPVFDGY